MPFEFGDIVLVPFPFTDQSASKRRPAVVVSASPDMAVMAVTTNVPALTFDTQPFAVIASAAKQSPSCIRTNPARDFFAALAITGSGDGPETSDEGAPLVPVAVGDDPPRQIK